ncbi:hypothetical protein M9H77_13533 [Catharanthus roseus]|uniref:Uncharacterized protein n=1 Tax=Catharanthus roseus TaxID=4058 RepID=A0ACC0BKN2_CATRO|nr:hypothetical protein M9H77_13533 [Catharanthus roseus]
MGSGSPIDDLVESGTLRLLDWNDSMTYIQLGMRFVDKVPNWSISVGREYRVVKSKSNQWTAKYYHHSDFNYYSWYIHIKKKITYGHREITRFIKERTCRIQIQQNKHRNMSSKFILISISHLVANDLKIPVSNVIQEVQRMNNKSCSCGKWQTYTSPYSHALVVCRENDTRADTYVPDIYSRETYRRTYQTNFHPVLNENFLRDVPYNFTFYPPNMNKEQSRKQGTRFQGKMDYRNPDSLPRCSRCRMPGHNRKNCHNPGQAMYKFVFLKVL